MVMNVGIRANQMLIWGFKFDMHIFITTSIKWGERTLRNLFSSFLITIFSLERINVRVES